MLHFSEISSADSVGIGMAEVGWGNAESIPSAVLTGASESGHKRRWSELTGRKNGG